VTEELRQLTPDEAAEVGQRIRTRDRLARRPDAARTSADAVPEPAAATEPDQAPAAPQKRAGRRSRATTAPASQTPTPAAAGSTGSSGSTSSPAWLPRGGGSPSVADDGAGFLLGIFAWALTLAYLRGGPTGARNWLRAKFVNKGPDGQWLP
jgi:hypothetical protein